MNQTQPVHLQLAVRGVIAHKPYKELAPLLGEKRRLVADKLLVEFEK